MSTATHEVENQVEPLAGHDLFATDRALVDALRFHAPAADLGGLGELGRLAGDPAMQAHARLANLHGPDLRTHDRVGRRVDTVEFHPSYHALLGNAIGHGLHAAPWASTGGHPHLERAAGFIVATQLEPSVLCPVSMTYAVAPALRGHPALHDALLPTLASRRYDPRSLPIAAKHGATMGMGMTEKQGGSDVRANTTRATFDTDTPWGRAYRLVGHKWFFSAPMSDAFLVLAQTGGAGSDGVAGRGPGGSVGGGAGGGLGCFFLPRVLPDGTPNAIRVQRLKDKLGNKANASAEVEFDGALAWLVGEEGRGIAQILEMGTLTRLDCALGTAGLMRGAVALALHHAAGRSAFGRRLVDQPLMKNVLADLAIESEAATALAMRLAAAVERQDDPFEAAIRRVLTPVAKYWVCKRGAALAQEAMECLGGNGYVEERGEGTMARIYREMPLNSIWEGAGNIMALDLLRALGRRDRRGHDTVDALAAELATARGRHPALDAATGRLLDRLDDALVGDEAAGRRLAQQVALALQGSLLARHAPEVVFDAFCASRLAEAAPAAFGTLASNIGFEPILQRAMPR